MLTDSNTISDNSSQEGHILSQKLILVTLMKGDIETKYRILEEIGPNHFNPNVFRRHKNVKEYELIFEMITQPLPDAPVSEVEWRQTLTEYLLDQESESQFFDSGESSEHSNDVVSRYLAIIDNILAAKTPDLETLDKAITTLKREYIREGIFHGNHVFAQKAILNTLIRGDEVIKARILGEVNSNDFSQTLSLIFEAIIESLKTKGEVEIAYLYQKMGNYVDTEVLASEMKFIDQILAKERPDVEELNKAIRCLQKLQTDHQLEPNEIYSDSAWAVIVALIKGNEDVKNRVLEEVNVDYFDVSADRIFAWARQLWQTERRIDKEGLYQKGKEYVTKKVIHTYTGVIDNLLELEFDDQTVDKAIEVIKRRQNNSAWR